jgi:hypothetical protein
MLRKQFTNSTAKNCLPACSEKYNCNAKEPLTFKAAYSHRNKRGVLI